MTPAVKAHLKNLNLNKLKALDKEEVRRTKGFLRAVLQANSTNPELLKNFPKGRSLKVDDLREVLGQLGHRVTDDQLNVMMYYINPYNDGKVSRSNIEQATRHVDRLASDQVTADLRDGVSVASSVLGSAPSLRSKVETEQLERVKRNLEGLAVKGKVREEDFRRVISTELDNLPEEQIDFVIEQASKVPNNPSKIFDKFLPRAINSNVRFTNIRLNLHTRAFFLPQHQPPELPPASPNPKNPPTPPTSLPTKFPPNSERVHFQAA